MFGNQAALNPQTLHLMFPVSACNLERMYFDQQFRECGYVKNQSPNYGPETFFPVQDLWGQPRIAFRETYCYIQTAKAVAAITEHSCGIPVINCSGAGLLDWHLGKLEDELECLGTLATAKKGVPDLAAAGLLPAIKKPNPKPRSRRVKNGVYKQGGGL